MSAASATRDHDRRGRRDRLHQRHINPRLHVSHLYCGLLRVDVIELGIGERAKSKA